MGQIKDEELRNILKVGEEIPAVLSIVEIDRSDDDCGGRTIRVRINYVDTIETCQEELWLTDEELLKVCPELRETVLEKHIERLEQKLKGVRDAKSVSSNNL